MRRTFFVLGFNVDVLVDVTVVYSFGQHGNVLGGAVDFRT